MGLRASLAGFIGILIFRITARENTRALMSVALGVLMLVPMLTAS